MKKCYNLLNNKTVIRTYILEYHVEVREVNKMANKITLRVSEFENGLIRSHAEETGISVSEFVRTTVMNAIEDDFLTEIYVKAYERYSKDTTKLFTSDEILNKYSED